jgi:Flp pilus assembly protein TadD
MRSAQEAMDRGDYQVATMACTHALEAYPACLTAHRVLGEAHLERGEADLATQHFDAALEIDPLNVVARLGLGVAAEEREDPTTAYTHYLNAWEINPALEQVREELVRLRLSLGREERLHPTRAGLASIYARGGQLGRAAAEWRALLHADPENVRSRSALAEVLWRAGDDAGAAASAKAALEFAPYNARLLAILADIERRQGSNDAVTLVERYQDGDPLGDVAASLSELRPGSELEFLRPGPLAIEPFEFTQKKASVPEPQTFAPGAMAASHLPAPDLWDNLVKDFSDDPMGSEPVGDVVPFAWTEDAQSPNEHSHDGSILGDAVTASAPAVELEPMVASAEPTPLMAAPDIELHDGEDLSQLFADQPFMAAVPEPARSDPFPPLIPEDDLSALMAEQGVPESIAAETPVDDLAALMVEPAPSADAVVDLSADTMFTTVLPDMTSNDPLPDIMSSELLSAIGVAPAVESPLAPPPVEAPNPFITADGRVDLTVGWDELDRTLAEATPNGDMAGGYEHLLAEIDAGGIAPFAAAEPAGDNEAWEPFTDDDVQAVAVAPEPAVAAAAPVAASTALPELDLQLDEDWGIEPVAAEVATVGSTNVSSAFSDDALIVPVEVATSIQMPSPSGYTEIFRNIDQDTLNFLPEEPPVNPLASPDLAGEPPDLAEVLSVAAHDSVDLSLELGNVDLNGLNTMTAEEWFAGNGASSAVADPVGAAVSDGASGHLMADPLISDLQGIEPFSFDEGGAGGLDSESAVDFSDVNEAPFDPSQYSVMPDLAALHDTSRPVIPPAVDKDEAAIDSFDGEFDLDFGAIESAAPVEVAAEFIEAPGGEEDESAQFAHRSWPAFVGMTSELSDRDRGGLFERLRAEKGALVEAGVVEVGLKASPVEAAPAAIVPAAPPTAEIPAAEPAQVAVESEPLKAPALSVVVANDLPQHGLDLVAMRDRLLESEDAAREVAEQLEAAVSRGTSDPSLLRALGEAYLKVGKSEQAAAQFRRAMLARRRAQ